MKKLLVVALACVLALTAALPAAATNTHFENKGNGELQLEGTVAESGTQIISVSMPYKVMFVVNVDAAGKFESLSSGEAIITNNSTCRVKLQITKVAQGAGDLLNKMKLSLNGKGAGMGTILAVGDNLAIDLLELKKSEQATLEVFGVAADNDPVIATGNYTVTPTITVTSAL